MDSNEFEVSGRKFKLGKLDAFRQFHIVRRIGPLLSEVLPGLGQVVASKSKLDKMSEEEKLEEFAKIAQPIMEGLAKLSDADADYVLFRLLSVVEVHQAEFNSWAKVATESQLVMQNLELPVLLQCAGRSLMFNLSGFFAILPQR